ncbi:uncharacterized protein K489DRAFT_383095 [Dissoconium aciculare CBS 342.82]|uniref:Major facilitator superfamily transporter n=1 Tax=Dissoconium aciculare CBS 342.82 TaxID=1314786 RepID=A0A6J3LX16_9PEZI|nr:uncharacterized protein K489DRAFT_383095 [Dissoconium aciculare CBS 342.82]KAF1820295.1 hypothetical protein K489DRAFT_383095 [Dissoconium aciculare CBS 342.82]
MSRYRSLSGAWVDVEKQRRSSSGFSEARPRASSRADFDSFRPTLEQSTSTAVRPPKYAYHLPRRRFGRYFTLAVSGMLLLFMFYLVRSSWTSQSELRLGLRKRPPRPPAWESFPFLKRYHGGIRTLVSRGDNKPEYPVEGDQEVQRLVDAAVAQQKESDASLEGAKGFQKRQGGFPRGKRFNPYQSSTITNDSEASSGPVPCFLDEKSKLRIPDLLSYAGVPEGFPDPVMGSYELLGLREDVCFERYGRLGPYGYGYSKKYGGSGVGMEGEKEGSEDVWGDELEIDYRKISWAAAQETCMKKNEGRFRVNSKQAPSHFSVSSAGDDAQLDARELEVRNSTTQPVVEGPKLNRTAIIIRTWTGYEYDAEDIFYLRALITELTLQSGSKYVVHFLVHVKDDSLNIWSDEAQYQKVLDSALPVEFRGMATLWSEKQMELVYSGVPKNTYRDLPVHGAYRSTYMPVQHFAHMHPEYEFFWHWEMDIRYTGHYGHLFNQVSQWAKQQPRKELWERNGRFYIPSEHGSWDDFRHMVRVQIDHGTASKQNVYGKLAGDAGSTHPLDGAMRRPETPVWGPLPPSNDGDSTVDSGSDPRPSTTHDKDKYSWGVGEEADLITFNPLFDPHATNWILAEDVTGYNTSGGFPPRRTAIITASRLSRRLLETMHRETSIQHHTMFSEMWPGSCALHHGYKAVYAPHPVYIDRAWPTSYLAAVMNNGRNGAAGGARTSVFSDERQHNFRGTTWYYDAGFSPNLWKRWLGYKVDNDGGEEWELANEGRMCLPGMLLHPVKHVDMVYEHLEGESGLY